MSTPDRRGMLDRADKALSIRRQCMLLGIARSGVYRPPRPANDNDLALMRRIDELFTAWPFLGSRRMTAMLKAEGLQVMCGRRPRCKKNLTFGLRSGASHVSGLFARHHDRWP